MKKLNSILIALLLVIVSLFGVVGCGVGSQSGLQNKTDEPQNEFQGEQNEMQAYVLNISANKQVYGEHDEIYIDIDLKNQTGEDKEIAYFFLFYPESHTGLFPDYEIPSVTTKATFKNGDTIHMTERLGGCFPVGQHELRFRAVFYLSWDVTELGWEETDNEVEIWSNKIGISVVKL